MTCVCKEYEGKMAQEQGQQLKMKFLMGYNMDSVHSPQYEKPFGLHLKNRVCTLRLMGWAFHTKHVFFFNIFSGDLFFEALIIEIF